MTNRIILRLAVPAVLTFSVAACGGEASPSPSAPASVEASESAPEMESPGADESSAPGVDLGDAASSVSNLSSYQLDITVDDGESGEQVMRVLATSDPKATHYSMSGFELITIDGEGAWINQGGTWVEAPGGADAYAAAFDALAPDTLIGAYSLGSYSTYFDDVGTEERNGVQATHYHLDASNAPPGAEFPTDGSFDVWVANDGGYLVAMQFSGTDPDSGQAVSMSIEVSRVNDSSLSIEPPI